MNPLTRLRRAELRQVCRRSLVAPRVLRCLGTARLRARKRRRNRAAVAATTVHGSAGPLGAFDLERRTAARVTSRSVWRSLMARSRSRRRKRPPLNASKASCWTTAWLLCLLTRVTRAPCSSSSRGSCWRSTTRWTRCERSETPSRPQSSKAPTTTMKTTPRPTLAAPARRRSAAPCRLLRRNPLRTDRLRARPGRSRSPAAPPRRAVRRRGAQSPRGPSR
mmetsp:Transcript_12611/g.39237  ORF Transcript_12611/g.39237 Transcript_12611/m.39237 type:complete len:221 (-) Transcript_12611:439-1101(-)